MWKMYKQEERLFNANYCLKYEINTRNVITTHITRLQRGMEVQCLMLQILLLPLAWTAIHINSLRIPSNVFVKQIETVSVSTAKRYVAEFTFKHRLHAITSRRFIAHALTDRTVLPFAVFCRHQAMGVIHCRIVTHPLTPRALKKVLD